MPHQFTILTHQNDSNTLGGPFWACLLQPAGGMLLPVPNYPVNVVRLMYVVRLLYPTNAVHGLKTVCRTCVASVTGAWFQAVLV